ncbi:F-box/kelch-repeat protein At3g06240-like isoform X2 [Papaver somniferum]|uniref:F-box/kelch-repeat protein At3g06240-like isoform X2 n=1 Tax=Papaver somniferum TaxID=3469 RepID=UPI000E6F4BEC|nr:F-box/kelch-repeat protein At3g06240-like isoform X2 [Papaver somniferum]
MSISSIPGEIFILIISRLPVRSVLACKCVSKSWKNLISDPDFVQMHLNFHKQNSNCLIGVVGQQDNNFQIHSIGYASLASLLLPEMFIEDESDDNVVEEDDSSSTLSEDSALSRIDGNAAQTDYPFKDLGLTVDLFGSCNGIVCLWFHDDDREVLDDFFCLWNPATNEYKRICEAPGRYRYTDVKLYAFVYDPMVDDYKFMIGVPVFSEQERSEMGSLIHLYSLATDSWKSFPTPCDFDSAKKPGVLFNGDLHWDASHPNRSIVSLDIRNEEFKAIQPPSGPLELLLVGVLEERLCVLVEDENDAIDIWKMEVYGDPESWTKRYTISHKIITSRIGHHCSFLRFMWSFENGVILFKDSGDLCFYDPEHGSAAEYNLNYMSAENYSESLVSLNSGIHVGGRMANSSYTELQKKLHESQVAYQHLEQHVNAQKEVVGSKKNEEEETAMTKRNGRKRKAQCQHNTRKASKAVAASPRESTIFEGESLILLQRAEQQQAKLVQLSTGGSLEPYEIKDGSKSHSTSKDSYQKMTVKSQHALLKERGLMVKGKKDELRGI